MNGQTERNSPKGETVTASLLYVSPQYAADLGAENIRLRDKLRRFKGWRVRYAQGYGDHPVRWDEHVFPPLHPTGLETARRSAKELKQSDWPTRNVRVMRVYRKANTDGK